MIKEHLRGAEARIKKATTDIDEEYRRLGAADGGIHARRLAELEGRKADVLAAKSKIEDHDNRIDTLEANMTRAELDTKKCRPSISAKRTDIQQCEDHLNNLLKDRGHQQGAYPQNMARLISAIRQDDGFAQKPVGPMGNHVRLLKPLWSSVLEKSFGGALNSFIVTSKQDQSRLSNLMQNINW
jgi:structural maintenance of chromosomes protein 6